MESILKQNIINDLGIGALPQEQQEEALARIGNIIFQGVLLRVMALMSDGDKIEFEKLLTEKNNKPEIILEFLRLKIANLDEVISEEVAKFKQESAHFMNNISSVKLY